MSQGRMIGVSVLLAAAVLIGACSPGSRPDVAEWEPTWNAVVLLMPDQSELGDPPDSDVCIEALGALRESSPDLHPTPDLALDEVVDQWVHVAESIVFECPPESHALPDLDHAYGELERLEAEVDAVLAFEREG